MSGDVHLHAVALLAVEFGIPPSELVPAGSFHPDDLLEEIASVRAEMIREQEKMRREMRTRR